jgi:hypothetical protein
MAETFREAGRRLWFSRRLSLLNEIVYFVGEIAGFIDPVKMWNALNYYDLTPRVKYTWIKLYFAMISPGKGLPAEFEEKRYLFLEKDELI